VAERRRGWKWVWPKVHKGAGPFMYMWENIVLLIASTFLIQFRHAIPFWNQLIKCNQMNYSLHTLNVYYIFSFLSTLSHTF
jgi:hypothetical protein